MKKYIKYVAMFLFLLVLFFLSPIAGDDWSNYLVGSEGLRHSLGVAVGMYFDWEGRIISRVLINILTYNKWLWNILNAIVVCSIIYMGMKLIHKKPKKIMFPLMVLVIIGMNLFSFSQVMTWIAGNITYLFVIPIILWYFYYVLNNDKYNKWFVVLFSLINLFGCMFVENMAVVLVGGNILLLIIKYIKNKKIDKRIILYLSMSVVGTLSMLLSPGTRYRNSIENLDFNKLNLFEKVIYNIPNFVYYTFIVNSFMLVIMNISNCLIINDKVKNKWVKLLLILFIISISSLSIIIYSISLFSNIACGLINHHNIFIILYWLVYLLISFILLFIYDNKKFDTLFLFLIGLGSNLCMLISPTWGFRTSFFTYLMFSIVSLKVINSYIKDRNLTYYIMCGCATLACVFYLVLYINIYRCLVNVEKMILKKSDVIYIDKFSRFAPCDINPSNEYHLKKFKEYYGLSDEVEIRLIDGKWIADIIYKG